MAKQRFRRRLTPPPSRPPAQRRAIRPVERIETVEAARFRHQLTLAIAPVCVAEFFHAGDAWKDHEDLAETLEHIVAAITERML